MVKNLQTVSLMLLLMGAPFVVTQATGSSVSKVNTIQQNSIAKGTVKDLVGEALIGASVVVKGTTNGTITDFDGNFELSGVSKGATLEISFVGYATQEIKFDGKIINIVLKENTEMLDELVVVGYGVQKKANLTGSVASINAEALESRAIASVSAAMAGTMPGVTSIQTSGAPGAQTGSITIRGKNSINAASPLVIVDGVPGSMNNIDPQDIESISVLKDAASAAIYGVQAANGVILITTKKGQSDQKARINYSGLVSWVSPTATLEFLDAAGYATLYNEATLNDNPNAVLLYSDADIKAYRNGTKKSTDWYKETFKSSALETQHNLSINGGTEKTTYMASLAYLFQDGLSQEKNYERYNGRINLDSQITNWISTGINASAYRGINRDEYSGFGSLLQWANRIPPTVPVYNEDGSYHFGGLDNPVANQGNSGTSRQMDQQLNATIYIDLTPIEGLSIKGLYNLRHDYRDYATFKKNYVYGNETSSKDSGKREGQHYHYNWNWYTTQLIANYIKSFGKHNFNILTGLEQVEYTYRYTGVYRSGGGNNELGESINTLDASSQKTYDGGYETARLSYFGRLQYDYMSKYLFEANFRADASSRFPKNNRWGYFPAFSTGWRVSEEAFIKDHVEWLSNLKIRLGWGRTGNEELKDNDIYPAIATYAYGSTMLGSSLYSTAYESRYVNDQLQWATVTNYELGLEAGFLNNKIGFELSLYKKKTDDMLLYLPIQGVIGMSAPAQNAGSVENTGFDLSIFCNNKINKDWSYAVNFNVAYVKNEITDMSGTEGVDPDNSKFWRLEGHPIGSFYGYVADGLFKTQEELATYPKRTGAEKIGDIKFKDLDGDKKITANDRTVIGKNFPTWTGGLNVAIYYKNFDFSMLWQGAFDVDAYYTGEAAYAFFNSGKVLTKHLDRFHENNNPDGDFPRLSLKDQTNYQTSSYWLEDASYVRLKNISLGYNLPKSLLTKVGIEKVKVFVTGENLLTFSGLDGLDAESPSDTRGAFYSNVKKISLGLKISF
ncbi:MAG: TonB-dependent receptor [Bacteroides sp.]|nr:TonB-dependent receptor [Bacteroides sp.]